MGELPDDVLLYIEHRFAVEDQTRAIALLAQDHVQTARIMRSVLYLANGSLSLLEHNIGVCKTNLAEILLNAEYVVGISAEPLPMRDMSLPFTHDGNLGANFTAPGVAKKARRRRAHRAPSRAEHHHQLLHATFKLGFVRYVVAESQHHPDKVKCYRLEAGRMRALFLPLVFVLEQLAEPVEMIDSVSFCHREHVQ